MKIGLLKRIVGIPGITRAKGVLPAKASHDVAQFKTVGRCVTTTCKQDKDAFSKLFCQGVYGMQNPETIFGWQCNLLKFAGRFLKTEVIKNADGQIIGGFNYKRSRKELFVGTMVIASIQRYKRRCKNVERHRSKN